VVERPLVELFDGERFLSEGEAIIVKPVAGSTGTHDVATFDIQNTGDGTLSITKIRLVDDTQDVFELVLTKTPTQASPITIEPKGAKGQTNFPITIRINPANLKADGTAKIEITSNPDKTGKTIHVLPLMCELPQAGLSINPGELNFGMVFEGDTKDLNLQMVNTGTDALIIDDMIV